MKKIYTDMLSGSTKAMTLWPLLLIKKKAKELFTPRDERHENIHGVQQAEMLVAGAIVAAVLAVCGCGWWSLLALPLFFWWYGAEWLVKWAYYRDPNTAYKNIGFEREAYINQDNIPYLDFRMPFEWVKYIF